MVGDILQPTHLLLILLVALLVLGPKRLPEVGRSLGKGIRDFRGAMSGIQDETSGFLNLNEPDEPEPSTTPDGPVNGSALSDETPSAATEVEFEEENGAVKASSAPAATEMSSDSSDQTAPAEAHATGAHTGAHEPDPSEYAD